MMTLLMISFGLGSEGFAAALCFMMMRCMNSWMDYCSGQPASCFLLPALMRYRASAVDGENDELYRVGADGRGPLCARRRP